MDIYTSTIAYLLNFPIFDSWQDMRNILQQLASRHPRDWQLPIIALFEGVIAPVRKLFETLGLSPDIFLTAVEPSNQE